jgi:restriction endonuclease S subunit
VAPIPISSPPLLPPLSFFPKGGSKEGGKGVGGCFAGGVEGVLRFFSAVAASFFFFFSYGEKVKVSRTKKGKKQSLRIIYTKFSHPTCLSIFLYILYIEKMERRIPVPNFVFLFLFLSLFFNILPSLEPRTNAPSLPHTQYPNIGDGEGRLR